MKEEEGTGVTEASEAQAPDMILQDSAPEAAAKSATKQKGARGRGRGRGRGARGRGIKVGRRIFAEDPLSVMGTHRRMEGV